MTQSDTYFVRSVGDGAKVTFGGAEIAGHTIKGNGSGELLVHGAGTLLVHLKAEAGFDQDGHKHPDHTGRQFRHDEQPEHLVILSPLRLGEQPGLKQQVHPHPDG